MCNLLARDQPRFLQPASRCQDVPHAEIRFELLVLRHVACNHEEVEARVARRDAVEDGCK